MKFNGFKYSIVDNYKDAIDEELLSSKITDYYNTFYYICKRKIKKQLTLWQHVVQLW